MKVSVIIPCYNHGRFLKESIPSILQQTHSEIELLVVDDKSTDSSLQIMNDLAREDCRIRVIEHRVNGGLSRSRNDALRLVSGDFIAFCDADDTWRQDKLERQLEMFRKNPDHDIAYSDSDIIDESGRPDGRLFSELFSPPREPSGWLFRDLCTRNFINVPSVLMRRSCLTQSEGFFDENIELVNDWWYWVQLSKRHQFLYSTERLARYRVHSNSTNVTQVRKYQQHRFKVFNRILRIYNEVPADVTADIYYDMAVDLQSLQKRAVARQLLKASLVLAVQNGELVRAAKAFLRLSKSTLCSKLATPSLLNY